MTALLVPPRLSCLFHEDNSLEIGTEEAEQCAKQAAAPGDLVLLDADGAVAIAAALASAILEASRARVRSETTLREQLQAGALSYDPSGLRAVVEGRTQS